MKSGDELIAQIKQDNIINKLIQECDECIRQSYICIARMALKFPEYYIEQWAYWLEIN